MADVLDKILDFHRNPLTAQEIARLEEWLNYRADFWLALLRIAPTRAEKRHARQRADAAVEMLSDLPEMIDGVMKDRGMLELARKVQKLKPESTVSELAIVDSRSVDELLSDFVGRPVSIKAIMNGEEP